MLQGLCYFDAMAFDDVFSPDAFENAVRVLMAMGGSANGVLHLQATASEMDLDIRPETFSKLSDETPLIADIAPSGTPEHHMGDLDEAGGIPAVMKTLEPLMALQARTVTGETRGANLKQAQAVNDFD